MALTQGWEMSGMPIVWSEGGVDKDECGQLYEEARQVEREGRLFEVLGGVEGRNRGWVATTNSPLKTGTKSETLRGQTMTLMHVMVVMRRKRRIRLGGDRWPHHAQSS